MPARDTGLSWPNLRNCANFVVFRLRTVSARARDFDIMRSIDEQSDTLRDTSIAGQATVGSLLERDSELNRMESVLAAVQRTRAGATIVLRGEAGIGKAALVEPFARINSRRLSCLYGGCEALFSPRPLGPVVDLTDDLPPALAGAIHGARPHHELFPAFLTYLRD